MQLQAQTLQAQSTPLQACVVDPDITVNALSEFMHRHQELKNKMEFVSPARGERVVGLTADAPQLLPPVTHAQHDYVTLPQNTDAYIRNTLFSHPSDTALLDTRPHAQ